MTGDDPKPSEAPLVVELAAHARVCLTQAFEGDGTTRLEGCESVEIVVIDAKRRIGKVSVIADLPDEL